MQVCSTQRLLFHNIEIANSSAARKLTCNLFGKAIFNTYVDNYKINLKGTTKLISLISCLVVRLQYHIIALMYVRF